jgi:hypothetical protein
VRYLKAVRAALAFAAAVLLLIDLCGCHRSESRSSTLEMADPAIAGQLVVGFYPVEENSFRWVAPKFSVALKPPQNGSRNGARLTVHLYLPEVEIKETGAVTLSAEVNEKCIGSQVFSRAGRFDFIQDLPAGIVDTNVLSVQFAFDKSMEPSSADERELAGVITGIEIAAGPGK